MRTLENIKLEIGQIISCGDPAWPILGKIINKSYDGKMLFIKVLYGKTEKIIMVRAASVLRIMP